MAIYSKTFVHNRDKILGNSASDSAGILPKDIVDYIESKDANNELGSTTNLQVNCTNIGNGTIFTTVTFDHD